MANPEGVMTVEVVYARPERQTLLRVSAPPPLTVRDAVRLSRIADLHTEIDFEHAALGVFGEPVTQDHALRDGDRVEIYRPLQMDPREARRRLAERGQVMGKTLGKTSRKP